MVIALVRIYQPRLMRCWTDLKSGGVECQCTDHTRITTWGLKALSSMIRE